ncbi:MAG: Mrp/NBP35 family ATP-binding protein [Ignavibacteria bacterium]|nr:Mrp/NBP35 family ATP-binding protein [Ignavibacteria bacterium]
MQDKIKEILGKINEPYINSGFNHQELLKKISLNGDKLYLKLGITDVNKDRNKEIKNLISAEIKKEIKEIKETEIEFVLGILSHKSHQKDMIISGVKNTIAVASGKGGVGKSTVAVNLAMALVMEGASVGLIDADIYGPSIPMMLNISKRPEVEKINGRNMLVPVEKYGLKVMSIGLLVDSNTAVVWRGPMASSALKQFMSDTDWGELDYLLFDMPPGTGDIQLTLSQTIPLTGAIIVTTPQEISLADARKGQSMFEKVNVSTVGVIENMSYFLKPDGTKEYIFGQGGGKKMHDETGIPLLGEIPINTKIREQGDMGTPIVYSMPEENESKIFRNISKNLILELNKLNLNRPENQNLEIIEEG